MRKFMLPEIYTITVLWEKNIRMKNLKIIEIRRTDSRRIVMKVKFIICNLLCLIAHALAFPIHVVLK